ncbi:hypothetical protein M011DRAFT_179999 [Sporormia fimetaria CBS 119925]|uniref:Uncharacterized protein n=1 Tax=Sporormia fimetaria CBS 119925 TaxID=1340428 RepID=A0A6A6VLK7_9PLEO|nr:hypothetical protein M011DRAFT_179999 [Sporormia fimetaria CBS 119925]
MPARTIPSPTDSTAKSPRDTTSCFPDDPNRGRTRSRSRSRSPSQSPHRPPVSPITPTISAAQLAPREPTQPQQPQPPPQRNNVRAPPTATFMRPPAPVPISESDNPDVIALRSAISLLQLQREKSKRDLKTLEEIKTAAVEDPEAFGRAIQAQARRKQSHNTVPDPLTPTLADTLSSESDRPEAGTEKDNGAYTSVSEDPLSKFAAIPQPQNIVRCPPVNWAKYHIVGEPLDRMHEEQRRWPGSTEPPRTRNGQRAPSHAVASPYSPFTDVLYDTQTTQGQKRSKKSPS